jgi:hypothetical protein
VVDPRERHLSLVKKGGSLALVTQDRIDRLRVAPVRARVADEHVVGIVRHVGPVPTYPVVASLLAETHGSQEVVGTATRTIRPQPVRILSGHFAFLFSAYSGFRLAALTTLLHFSVCSARYFPNSEGEATKGVEPSSASRAFNFASAMPALISLFSLSTISRDRAAALGGELPAANL